MFICPQCNKRFKEKISIQQHHRDKHGFILEDLSDFDENNFEKKISKKRKRSNDDDEFDETAYEYQYSQGPIFTDDYTDGWDW